MAGVLAGLTRSGEEARASPPSPRSSARSSPRTRRRASRSWAPSSRCSAPWPSRCAPRARPSSASPATSTRSAPRRSSSVTSPPRRSCCRSTRASRRPGPASTAAGSRWSPARWATSRRRARHAAPRSTRSSRRRCGELEGVKAATNVGRRADRRGRPARGDGERDARPHARGRRPLDRARAAHREATESARQPRRPPGRRRPPTPTADRVAPASRCRWRLPTSSTAPSLRGRYPSRPRIP